MFPKHSIRWEAMSASIVSLTMTVQEWKQYSKSERSMMLPGIYVTPRKSTVDVKI